MNPQVAQTALQFLLRQQTTLFGNEVSAFNLVVTELAAIANPPQMQPAPQLSVVETPRSEEGEQQERRVPRHPAARKAENE